MVSYSSLLICCLIPCLHTFLTSCSVYGLLEDYESEGINDYTVSKFMQKTKASSQGMAIWGDNMFVLHSGGNCDVYNLRNQSFISSFRLASAEGSHCNCANFGSEYVDGGTFPLMYVTNGLVGSLTEYDCLVESISLSVDNEFSSKLVQTITLDTKDFGSKCLHTPWGCPQWLVDSTRGFLWVFSADLRTLPSITGDYTNNTYHATQFRLPKLCEGDKIVLQANDVLNQVLFEFDTYITQGGCMDDGIIYYTFGYGGKSGDTTNKIRIYNTDNGLIEERMNLKGEIVEELEDASIYCNNLLLNTSSATIYKVKRK